MDTSSTFDENESEEEQGEQQYVEDKMWKAVACNQWVEALPLFTWHQEKAVRLLLPCAGFDAPGHALRAMAVNFEVLGAWDTSIHAGRALRHAYPSLTDKQLHLGRDKGDVMRVDIEKLPDVDGLVSGPPCPPFSGMGSKLGWKDPRADVLLRILQWCARLSQMSLKFFVLENVVGMLHKRAGKKAPIQKVMRILQRDLHGSWNIEVVRTNSHCTGQNRKRIYIVGCREWCSPGRPIATRVQKIILKMGNSSLSSVIEPSLPNTDKSSLPETQQKKLRAWHKKFRDAFQDTTKQGMYGCFNVDRRPSSSWGCMRCDGYVSCLRASAGEVWVVSLGERKPTVNRKIHAAEVCLLQGFSPSDMPRDMIGSRRKMLSGMGNAMTVPVVGAVMWVAMKNTMSEASESLKRKR